MEKTLFVFIVLSRLIFGQTFLWERDVSDTSTIYENILPNPTEWTNNYYKPYVSFRKNNNVDIVHCETGNLLVSLNIPNIPNSYSIQNAYCQKWFDNDDGWEILVNYFDSSTTHYKQKFKVFDGSTVLLEGDGRAWVFYLNSNTYLDAFDYYGKYRVWKFREGIPIIHDDKIKSDKNVANSYFCPFNRQLFIDVNLIEGNVIQFKMFDLLGREYFKTNKKYSQKGEYKFKIDLTSFANGVYISELDCNKQKKIDKITITK